MSVSLVPEVRNYQFAMGEHVPRYWHGGRRSVTLFFNNLSVFFPPGERFFVQSVKRYRDRITDPKLRADVKAFCAQEGIHSREHVRYNDMLRGQGYPIDEMEGRLEHLLQQARTDPERMQLGLTCALEHFTALMANLLLNDSMLMDGAHPTMAAIWRWHAAEENEHKAVAFDVFREIGGSYPERALTMVGATLFFWAKVFEHQVRLMHKDGIATSPSEWLALFRFLFQKGGMQSLVGPYLAYFKPNFHPWQHDTREAFERWKQQASLSPEYRLA